MSRPFTSSIDKDFGDSFIDVSKTERRLLRVTTKTYESTVTNNFLKLFKKGADAEFYIDQRVTLTVLVFQELINNVENINIGPQPGRREVTTAGALKRPEKWFQNRAPAKPTEVSTNSIEVVLFSNISIEVFHFLRFSLEVSCQQSHRIFSSSLKKTI